MMLFSRCTLRPDAIGLTAATVLTAGAAAVIVGPSILAGPPAHQVQGALLEQRKRLASSLDREVDSSTKRLVEVRAQALGAVQLIPANHVNQRLGETLQIAGSCGVLIAQLEHAEAKAAEAKSLVVPIKLAGSAAYPDITRFMHTLHDRFRDTAVRSLKITAPPITVSPPDPPDPSKPEAAPPAVQATFTLDLAWYCAPADSAASAGSAGAPSKP